MDEIVIEGKTVRPIYYFKYGNLKDKDGNPIMFNGQVQRRPIVTVCLIGYEGNYSRGISICSPKDQFSKITGKCYALINAVKGIHILMHVNDIPSEKKMLREERNRALGFPPRQRGKEQYHEPIKRPDIFEMLRSYDIVLPIYYKISTFAEELLTKGEKDIINMVNRGNRGTTKE